jgi:hypothetical protein
MAKRKKRLSEFNARSRALKSGKLERCILTLPPLWLAELPSLSALPSPRLWISVVQ